MSEFADGSWKKRDSENAQLLSLSQFCLGVSQGGRNIALSSSANGSIFFHTDHSVFCDSQRHIWDSRRLSPPVNEERHLYLRWPKCTHVVGHQFTLPSLPDTQPSISSFFLLIVVVSVLSRLLVIVDCRPVPPDFLKTISYLAACFFSIRRHEL